MDTQQSPRIDLDSTKTKSKTKVFLAILPILGFAVALSMLILVKDNSSNSKIVAIVNNSKQITLSELINKNRIETAYMGSEYVGKEAIENYKILYKLIQEKIMELIAEKYKIDISQGELDNEYNRIHNETLRPDLLQGIESSLDNKNIFINLFVKPVVIKNKLVFFYNSQLSQLDPAFKKMSELLVKVKNDPSLFKAYDNIELKKFLITKNRQTGTNNFKNYTELSHEDYRPSYDEQLFSKIKSLTPTEILSEVYYTPQSLNYSLVRVDAIEDQGIKISKLLYNKMTFDQWVDSEILNFGKVIVIKDSTIKEEIRKNYGNTALSSMIAD